MATVVADRGKERHRFFPFNCQLSKKLMQLEKFCGFFKREGRPSEKETLVSRLIDRPIRPLFAEGFKCETQVIATVISYDNENDLILFL